MLRTAATLRAARSRLQCAPPLARALSSAVLPRSRLLLSAPPLARMLSTAPPAAASTYNPLLGTSMPAQQQERRTRRGKVVEEEAPRGLASFRNLPVSPRKLTVCANMATGLFVREAMLQLEFSRKNISVMVKNAIASAVKDAEENHGLDPTLLVVGARRPRSSPAVRHPPAAIAHRRL